MHAAEPWYGNFRKGLWVVSSFRLPRQGGKDLARRMRTPNFALHRRSNILRCRLDCHPKLSDNFLGWFRTVLGSRTSYAPGQ
jgi:hypothetical protein